MNDTIGTHAAPDQIKAVSLKDILLDKVIPHLVKISSAEHTINTGYERLDKYINGFRPGELTIIGARPAMDQGSFILGMSLNIAKKNQKVLFISKDMSYVQFGALVISMEGRIEKEKITRKGHLSSEEWLSWQNTYEKIGDLSLFLIENTEYNRSFSVERATELGRKMKADIVFFDFLPDDADLKQMATMLNAPVVATCQLKRSDDSPGRHTRPRVTDLLASNKVLIDADVILLLYRENCYDGFSLIVDDENVVPVEAIVAKSKYGACGTIEFLFHRDYYYFTESNEDVPL